MSRPDTRMASALLIAILLLLCLLLLQLSHLAPEIIGLPPITRPDVRVNRPLQSLFQLEAQAARDGWTSENLRLAGNRWREAGDLTRAVVYWEATAPDVFVLRDRAEAYLALERWAVAADAFEELLTLLPVESSERVWAQLQSGFIRAVYDPARALELLHAAQPAESGFVAQLILTLETDPDPTRIGLVFAFADLWSYAELAFSQSPGDPLAWAYGGLARDMQGKDGAAWVELAVELAPESAQVRLMQGLHLRLTYDYPASLEAIIQAVALDPENPALYAELGKAYQLAGDLITAERWLKYAVTLDERFEPFLDSFYEDETALMDTLGLLDEAVLPFDPAFSPEP